MSRPDLPAAPQSIAAMLHKKIKEDQERQLAQQQRRPTAIANNNKSTSPPPLNTASAPSPAPASPVPAAAAAVVKPSVQAQIKLPQPPRSITGKPILRLRGTRVVFRRPADAKEMLYEGTVREYDEATSSIAIESGGTTFTGIPIEDPNTTITTAANVAYVTAWSGPADVLQTDDLVAIRFPDALSVLYGLQQRFFAKMPYTWLTRDSLVYVNPFQKCPDVFAGGQPHPFSVAEQARNIIREDVCDVAAVITGQSGAGKTEAAKMILRHFAATALAAASAAAAATSTEPTSSPAVSPKAASALSMVTSAATATATATTSMTNDFVSLIAAVNPILESFGNAVTAANPNSSRFIRTTRITTDRTCRPRQAEIHVALLETARLCGLRPAESSFHIFYCMLGGLPARDKIELELTDPTLFRCLVTQIDAATLYPSSPSSTSSSPSSSVQPPNWLVASPPHKLHTVVEAMKEVGMTEADIRLLFRMLSFILHLLNVEFGGSDPMQARVVSASAKRALETAAKLLKIDAAALEDSMTVARFTDPATQKLIVRRFTVAGATASRDTIARNLYSSLFMWIVAKVNDSLALKCAALRRRKQNIHNNNNNNNSNNSVTTDRNEVEDDVDDDDDDDVGQLGGKKLPSLLILDVFGFESMRNVPNAEGVAPPALAELNCHNGLEQLLINFVNEELQHLFTETSLIGFCDELTREGIVLSSNAPGHHHHSSSSTSSGQSPQRQQQQQQQRNDNDDDDDKRSGDGVVSKSPSSAASQQQQMAIMTPAETMARELAASQNRTMDCLGRKSGGILSTINDDSMLTNPAPAAVLQDRILALAAKNPAVIKKLRGVPDPDQPSFIVEHFACPVLYSTAGMSAKNKVSSGGLAALIPLLSDRFPEALELLRAADSATRRSSSIVGSSSSSSANSSSNSNNTTSSISTATTFTKILREQIDALLATLKASRCIWVRCIKPNSVNTPNVFDARDVKRQLLTAGVLASTSVLAQGLSVRLSIRDFAMRFAVALDKYPWRDLEKVQYKKICEAIAKKVAALMVKREQKEQPSTSPTKHSSPYTASHSSQTSGPAPMQIGLTKVFLNTEAYEELTTATSAKLAGYLTVIQKAARGHEGRSSVAELLRAAVRRRLAHELALRIEAERPIREQLELDRCMEEEQGSAALAAMRPRSAAVGRAAASLLSGTVKPFLGTMRDELHRVCVDIALLDRLKAQREGEMKERAKLVEQMQLAASKKHEREERGANLQKFKALPVNRRITAEKDDAEQKNRVLAEAKMRSQINLAHGELSRQQQSAEVGLQKGFAKNHAVKQVDWLHEHLHRSWQRLDHQADIHRSRVAQQSALPGYQHDVQRRAMERSVSGRRSESIMSPAVDSSPPTPNRALSYRPMSRY